VDLAKVSAVWKAIMVPGGRDGRGSLLPAAGACEATPFEASRPKGSPLTFRLCELRSAVFSAMRAIRELICCGISSPRRR
jgi:hypothetical protein